MSDRDEIIERAQAASPDRIEVPRKWRRKRKKPTRKVRWQAAATAGVTASGIALSWTITTLTDLSMTQEEGVAVVVALSTLSAFVSGVVGYFTRPGEEDQIEPEE